MTVMLWIMFYVMTFGISKMTSNFTTTKLRVGIFCISLVMILIIAYVFLTPFVGKLYGQDDLEYYYRQGVAPWVVTTIIGIVMIFRNYKKQNEGDTKIAPKYEWGGKDKRGKDFKANAICPSCSTRRFLNEETCRKCGFNFTK
jgi:hypothetical protein